jgi:rhomboid protease GluP
METRRMCPNCRAFITTRDRVCPYCEAQVGPRAADFRNPSDVAGLIPHARFTTVVILLINFGLYVATALFSIKQGNSDAWLGVDGLTLLRFGAKYTPIVFAGDWWRLVTAGFLHGGLLHILMNSWVLFDLGTQVEEFYGTARYLVFYIIATMGGFLASCYWNPAISIGASAGIFGLIGAMIAVGVTHQSSLGLAIRGLYIRWAIYGLIFWFAARTGDRQRGPHWWIGFWLYRRLCCWPASPCQPEGPVLGLCRMGGCATDDLLFLPDVRHILAVCPDDVH